MANPKKIELNVEIPEGLDTSGELENLRDEIQESLSQNLGGLTNLAEIERIDYQAWRGDRITTQQLEEIGKLFGTAPNSVGDKLTKMLQLAEDDPTRKVAVNMLKAIVDNMESYDAVIENVIEKREELSGDIYTDTLRAGTRMIGENLTKNPWLTIAAGGILAYGVYWAWNNEKLGGPVKLGAAAAGLGWAVNFFSKSFTKDGRSLLDKAAAWMVPPDEVDALVSEVGLKDAYDDDEKYPDIDIDAFTTCMKLGGIPFGTFLDLYETAREKDTGEIKMETLRKAARRLGVKSDALNQGNGKGLYQILEDLIGDNANDFREKYVNTPFGDYSLLRVMINEYHKESDVDAVSGSASAAASSSAGGGAGGAAAAPSTRPSLAEKTKATTDRADLLTIPKFDEMSPDLRTDGTADIMGFNFTYTRAPGSYDGKPATIYRFTDSRGEEFLFSTGEGAQTDSNEDIRVYLEEYLEVKAKRQARTLGFDLTKVTLEWDDDKWMIKGYQTELPTGFGPQPRAVDLELYASNTDKFYASYQGKKLTTLDKVDLAIAKHEVARTIQSQPNLGGLSVEVTGFDTSTHRIVAKVAGGDAEFVWNSTSRSYELKSLTISDSVIRERIDAVEKEGSDFDTAFDRIAHAAPPLSLYWRSLLDLSNLELPSETNEQWAALVEFKRTEIINSYRKALEDIPASDPDALQKMEDAYEETIQKAVDEFDDFGSRLTQTQRRAEGKGVADQTEKRAAQRKYEKMQQSFTTYGYSDSYKRSHEAFMRMLGGVNFSNLDELSNTEQYQAVLILQMVWHDRTAFMMEEDWGPGHPYQEYMDYVSREMERIINDAEMSPTEVDNWVEKGWQKFAREGVSLKEVEDLKGSGRFNEVETYDQFWARQRRVPEIESAVPMLRGIGGLKSIEPIPGTTPPQTKIKFADGGSWTITETTGGKFEVTDMILTDSTIDTMVESVRGSDEFNKPYRDLAKVFEGRNLSIDWSKFVTSLPEFIWGNVDEGAWGAMVEHKKWEALEMYRQDLEAIMDGHYNPATQARKVEALHQSFAQLYMSDLETLNTAISRQLTDKETRGESIEEDDFARWFDGGLEIMGYSDEYAVLISGARDYYDLFNYSGLESTEAEGPYEVENLLLRLIYRKTRFMNEPGHTITDQEKMYFRYVREEVDQIARDAKAGRVGTGTWLIDAIGADEILDNALIDDFEKWKTTGKGKLIPPNYVIPTPAAPSGPAPTPPGPSPTPTLAEQVWKDLNTTYTDNWLDVVYAPATGVPGTPRQVQAPYVEKKVRLTQPDIDSYHDAVYREIMLDPSKKQALLAEYALWLEKRTKSVEPWYHFW